MLPVRVKSVSSAHCTLPEASALLQRFLSSDACSDSFARGYAASVALALSESASRGCLTINPAQSDHLHHHHQQQQQQEKQSHNVKLSSSAVDALPQIIGEQKKKRNHSSLETKPDATAVDTPSSVQELSVSSSQALHQSSKKRRKEKQEKVEIDSLDADLAVKLETEPVSVKKSAKKKNKHVDAGENGGNEMLAANSVKKSAKKIYNLETGENGGDGSDPGYVQKSVKKKIKLETEDNGYTDIEPDGSVPKSVKKKIKLETGENGDADTNRDGSVKKSSKKKPKLEAMEPVDDETEPYGSIKKSAKKKHRLDTYCEIDPVGSVKKTAKKKPTLEIGENGYGVDNDDQHRSPCFSHPGHDVFMRKRKDPEPLETPNSEFERKRKKRRKEELSSIS